MNDVTRVADQLRFTGDPANPSTVILRVRTAKAGGPMVEIRLDLEALDELAATVIEVAAKIRERPS